MIYTPQTKKAIKICFEQHKNQLDKSGMPYVFHPFHVAEQMSDENTTIVALLHDVVEDTDLTLEDIRNYGFNEEVLQALSLMTHEKDVPYFDYIKRLASNDIARTVKIADLEHNSDLSRLDEVKESDLARAEKYKKSLEFLKTYTKQQDNNIIFDYKSIK